MKIIMFGVHDGEHKAIDAYATRNNLDITKVSNHLTIETYDQIKGHDALCIQQSVLITDELIYQKIAEFGIKQISLRTAGYDIINLEYAKKYNLVITNVPAYSPNAIAEMALTQTMYLVRKMYVTLPKVASNDFSWQGSLAPEIRSLTVGIIGVGRIGSVYAKLVSGLGAKVIGYDIKKNMNNDFIEYKDSLEELLQEADVVSLHVFLDESTISLINKKTIALMKKSSYLINTSRGPVVNSTDLIEALKSNQIAGAGLDTIDCEVGYFANDYSNKDITDENLSELLKLDNTIITPHISFYTHTALENMVDISLDSLMDIMNNNICENIVT